MSNSFTRRSFLRAAAAPAFLRAQGANEKLQVGWIDLGVRGYGLIGTLMEVAPAAASIKAVCNTYTGYLARGKDRVQTMQKTTPDTYDDYRRMLEDKSIDAVFVITPGHLHRVPPRQEGLRGCSEPEIPAVIAAGPRQPHSAASRKSCWVGGQAIRRWARS